MKRILFVAAATLLLAGCGVNPTKAKRALEAQGITNVEIGGYAWLGCGQDDSFASHFTGTGSNGKPVSGVLCSGFLKGVTVRFD